MHEDLNNIGLADRFGKGQGDFFRESREFPLIYTLGSQLMGNQLLFSGSMQSQPQSLPSCLKHRID